MACPSSIQPRDSYIPPSPVDVPRTCPKLMRFFVIANTRSGARNLATEVGLVPRPLQRHARKAAGMSAHEAHLAVPAYPKEKGRPPTKKRAQWPLRARVRIPLPLLKPFVDRPRAYEDCTHHGTITSEPMIARNALMPRGP